MDRAKSSESIRTATSSEPLRTDLCDYQPEACCEKILGDKVIWARFSRLTLANAKEQRERRIVLMKRIARSILGTLSLAFLTVWLASSVAGQACLTLIAGVDMSGSLRCTLTGEDASYCYYNCTCTPSCGACSGDCSSIANQLDIEFD